MVSPRIPLDDLDESVGLTAQGSVADVFIVRIFWWTTIIGAACFLLFVFLYEETKYDPVHQADVVPNLQTEVIATAHGGRKAKISR